MEFLLSFYGHAVLGMRKGGTVWKRCIQILKGEFKMKGKIRYFAKIEKEIEIPDRLIELNEKDWDRTEEEDAE